MSGASSHNSQQKENKYHYKALPDNKDDGIHLGSLTVNCFNTNMIRET